MSLTGKGDRSLKTPITAPKENATLEQKAPELF